MAARLTDWQEQPPVVTAVRALLAACTAVDRVTPLSGHVLDGLETPPATPGTARFLAAYDGELLVGLAVDPGSDPAEIAVHPGARNHGLGGLLLDRVLRRTRSIWAHGALPAAHALAAARHLLIARELLQMRRSLNGELPPIELPHPAGPTAAGPTAAESPAAASGVADHDPVRLRTFVPGQDEDAFLAVNARAFSWHPEQGRLDRTGLAAEMAQDWFDPAGFFLAVDSGDRVLGFHWTKVHAVDPTPGELAVGDAQAGPIGEIYVLGVDPGSPVRGLGRPLSIAGLEYLRDRGLAAVMLYVEGDNAPAVRLYERLGFQRYLTDVVYRLPSPDQQSGSVPERAV